MPALDLLRAFSIIPVVILHTSSNKHVVSYLGYLGSYGVLLFFCISGFLLSYLAFEEIKINGYFDVKAFYIRRVLRIWPNYFLYILSINIFLLTAPDLTKWFLELFLSIFFLGNLLNSLHPFIEGIPHGSLHFNVLWSLAVEEQFYLFFPIILVFFKKNNLKNIILFIISVLILISGVRFFLIELGLKLNYSKSHWPGIAFQTLTYIDIILFSVFLGYLKSSFDFIIKKKLIIKVLYCLATLFILLSFFFFRNLTHLETKYSFGFVTMGIILGLITYLSSYLDIKTNFITRVLISIGKQSYGIYLFHIPIFLVLSILTFKINVTLAFPTIWVLILSYFFSLLLYKYYEVHFRNLRIEIRQKNSMNITIKTKSYGKETKLN